MNATGVLKHWLRRCAQPFRVFLHLLAPLPVARAATRQRKIAVDPLQNSDILFGYEDVPAVLYHAEWKTVAGHLTLRPGPDAVTGKSNCQSRTIGTNKEPSAQEDGRLHGTRSHSCDWGRLCHSRVHFSTWRKSEKLIGGSPEFLYCLISLPVGFLSFLVLVPALFGSEGGIIRPPSGLFEARI